MIGNYPEGMSMADMAHVNGEEYVSDFVQGLRDRFFEDMMDNERLEDDNGQN